MRINCDILYIKINNIDNYCVTETYMPIEYSIYSVSDFTCFLILFFDPSLILLFTSSLLL